jgi:N-methylhydantoinase B
MREAIAGLPDGIYEGEDFLDDDGPDGRPAAIRVRVEIAGDSACFDFTGTDDAVAGPLNTTPFVAMAAVYYAIKAVAGPEIQPNGGCYRPLEIRTRPGSILEPGIDKPVVGGNHETSQRAVDAIMRALDKAVPERLAAGGSTTAGLLIFGGTRRDGAIGTFYETHGGGEGAGPDRDGMPVVRVHLTNTMNTPVEIVESEYLIRVEEQRLRPGSGGAGRRRGGDGMRRVYVVLGDGLSLTTMFERRVIAPYGLQGGADGAPFRVTLHRAAGGSRELSGKENLTLAMGDRVVMETSGGGGYGMEPAPAPSPFGPG